jgi:Ca2+/Na+ antiporter
VHVYLSNTELLQSLNAIKDAGYLTIPNQNVMRGLKDFGPAFCGGIFFTFSVGAGISFIALSAAWAWDRLFSRKRYLLYVYLSLWLLFLVALNFHGFKLLVSLYFLIIPPAVFVFTARSLSHSNKQNRHRNEIIHIIPVIVLALFLFWQADGRMFTDFRDIFLLSNPVGSKINNFYYKYTLYPAEVFKSLNQKMLKTCRVEKVKKIITARALQRILISNDYIPITSNIAVDLELIQKDNDFILRNRGEFILQRTSKEFFANPEKALKLFANKSDAHPIFRQIIFISLLMGLPIAVYMIGHGLTSLVFSLFFNIRTSSVIASGICFVLCLILFYSFHLNRSRNVSISNLPDALNSERWQERVAALKIIDEKGLEIRSFQAYPKIFGSTCIPERYWFIRTLANSRSSATYRDLVNFLDDPHPNVQSMAFYALGQRGNTQAIGKIIHKIETSNDWYSQWYAYRALRSLGWKQTKLK